MIKIDRNDIRQIMKHLREGKAIYLNGKRISFINNDKFIIEYTYNGSNNKVERSGSYIRKFIKNDYLNENLYLV